jgi:predicted membrane protein
MNKKANTLLFILGATVFNVIVTVGSFVLLLLLFFKVLAPLLGPRLNENTAALALPLLFVAAIAVAFVLYRLVLKVLMKRIDVDKYFDPIFKPRGRK